MATIGLNAAPVEESRGKINLFASLIAPLVTPGPQITLATGLYSRLSKVSKVGPYDFSQ